MLQKVFIIKNNKNKLVWVIVNSIDKVGKIESQIFYSTIKYFTNWANWNLQLISVLGL